MSEMKFDYNEQAKSIVDALIKHNQSSKPGDFVYNAAGLIMPDCFILSADDSSVIYARRCSTTHRTTIYINRRNMLVGVNGCYGRTDFHLDSRLVINPRGEI